MDRLSYFALGSSANLRQGRTEEHRLPSGSPERHPPYSYAANATAVSLRVMLLTQSPSANGLKMMEECLRPAAVLALLAASYARTEKTGRTTNGNRDRTER